MISKQQPDANEQYEVMIADLTNQVDALRRKLKSNENEANQRVGEAFFYAYCGQCYLVLKCYPSANGRFGK